MKPIFIFNAPPQTGKDTICNSIFNLRLGVNTASFKDPMFDIFLSSTGMLRDKFEKLYATEGWKDTPNEITGGKTPREFLIHISEVFIKPIFGNDYFGLFLKNHIKQFESTHGESVSWVIPDGGFPAEIKILEEEFGERVIIIQLEREGKRDFGNDSRNWVSGKKTFRFDTSKGNDEVVSIIKDLLV